MKRFLSAFMAVVLVCTIAPPVALADEPTTTPESAAPAAPREASTDTPAEDAATPAIEAQAEAQETSDASSAGTASEDDGPSTDQSQSTTTTVGDEETTAAEGPTSPTDETTHVQTTPDEIYAALGIDVDADGLDTSSDELMPLSVGRAGKFKDVLNYAWQYYGLPYVWGGKNPASGGFDCSGLVCWVYNHAAGTSIDGNYTNAASLYWNYTTHVSRSEAKPGDLVFFTGTYGSPDYISHVGIYCGNGIMFNAGDPIGFDEIDSITKEDGSKAGIYFGRLVDFDDTSSDVKFSDLASGTYQLQNAGNPDMFLDVAGASTGAGANLQVFPKRDTANQKFYVDNLGDGYVTIEAVNSGAYVDVAGSGRRDCTNVSQYPKTGGANQQWLLKDAGGGYFYLVSKCNGLYLDAAGTSPGACANVQVFTGHYTKNQRWKFVSTSVDPVLKDGTYTIQSGLDSSKVLDIAGYSSDNGANVQSFSARETANQTFKVTHLGNGRYAIRSVYSGKALDAAGGSIANNTNLQSYRWNDTPSQHWILQDAGDGYFTIISQRNGLAVDIKGASKKDCANVQLHNANGTDAQKFTFVSAGGATVSNGTYAVASAADGRVLDVAGKYKRDCGNIQVFPDASTWNQRFTFTHLGGGFYRVENATTGLALDAAGIPTRVGTNVQQFTWWKTCNQVWKISDDGAGGFTFTNGCGRVLGVVQPQKACSNVVLQDAKAGAAYQTWKLTSSVTPASDDEVAPASDEEASPQAIDVSKLSNGSLKAGRYYITSAMNSSLCLDVVDFSKNECANVQTYTSAKTANQQWDVIPMGYGVYEIRSVNSAMALDAAGKAQNGANVQQFGWHATANQKWIVKDAGDGYFYILASGTTDQVLDIAGFYNKPGGNVQTYACNGTSNQKWKFNGVAVQNLANGTYTISSRMNSNLVLDVVNFSQRDCANVQTYTDAGTSNQKWNVNYVGNGLYEMTNVNSGKALDSAGPTAVNGTNVQQFTNWKTANQRWYLIDAGGGYFYVFNNSGQNRCLDVAGFYNKPCGNVQMFQGNGTNNQMWKFTRVDNISDGYYYISSGLDSNKVVDIAGGSFGDCANAQLFTNHGTSNQKFAVTNIGGGYYTIAAASSGLALDAAGGTGNNTNVQQFTNWRTANQKWVLKYAGDGYYNIVCGTSGNVLDVKGGKSADCTNLQLHFSNGTAAQKFKFTKTTLSKQQFITSCAHWARYNKAHNGRWVLPSVSIAQACLESNYGNSLLSISGKNYYGIKAGTSWTGRVYTANTQEEYTPGQMTTIVDSFRAYNSLRDSVNDYSALITGNSRYAGAVNNGDARGAVQAIKDGGYATSSSYVSSVMSVIDSNGLTKYDR